MAERRRPLVIAVDGPVAAGKGTLARRLAAALGLRHLDSGMLYRAVAAKMLRLGVDPTDREGAVRIARTLEPADLEAPELRDEKIGELASAVVSVNPAVREALLAYMRRFAAAPPGAVIDGRDIGTVVFPDADCKLYVTADLEARVERRWRELRDRGAPVSREEVRAHLIARDSRDASRPLAPLKPAPDAVVIDTTHLNIEEALATALAAVKAACGVSPRPSNVRS